MQTINNQTNQVKNFPKNSNALEIPCQKYFNLTGKTKVVKIQFPIMAKEKNQFSSIDEQR